MVYRKRRGNGRGNTASKGRLKQLDKHIEEDFIAEVQLYGFPSQKLFFIIDIGF